MKRLFSVFIICAFFAPTLSVAVVNVKKAAPVATKKSEPIDSATSLLPSVLTLVGNVRALNTQQQQLVADCVPTADEINTVNELVKEWAKISETDAQSAISGLGEPCGGGTNSDESLYRNRMMIADKKETCYIVFHKDSDDGMIWQDFPRASVATNVCQGADTKNCKNISNLYDVFVKIPFSEEDFTKAELAKVNKLIEKSQKCAPSKILAAKAELWGGFLNKTLGGVGQSAGVSGTSAVIEAVSSMGGNGGIQSMLPSLGQMATQMIEK